jgi:hypothetical protein
MQSGEISAGEQGIDLMPGFELQCFEMLLAGHGRF